MPTDAMPPETYPARPLDWTTDDVARFWKANGKRRVRCRLSGREGRFEAILNSQAHVRFSNGLEFRTHCANLVVLDDETASFGSATDQATYREGDYVEPADEDMRAARRAGQILMAQPLPAGQYLTVQPFGGGVMWSMPSDRVRMARRPDPRNTEQNP